MEIDRDVGEAISFLFERQLDVQSDGFPLRFGSATIGGFHDAGAAAGDDGEFVFGQAFGDIDGGAIERIAWRRARRAEDRDGEAELGEGFERIDKFGHDAEDAPGIFTHETEGVLVHAR